MITAGLSGATRHGCVALAERERLFAVCGQERASRVRNAGFTPTGLPDDALDLLLQRNGLTRAEIARYVLAESGRDGGDGLDVERVDHHLAHACAAYLTSPHTSAAIVVCDHEAPRVSVWEGRGAQVSRVDWEWTGPGFADVYSRCARAFGFPAEAGDQRLEALARLRPNACDSGLSGLFSLNDTGLSVDAGLEGVIEERLSGVPRHGVAASALAAALQARLIELFLEFLARVHRRTGHAHLCLAGSFFYHSSVNARAKLAGVFPNVFVPIDPGDAGLAVGVALRANGSQPQSTSPFLGPSYSSVETHRALENCKLQYSWESEEDAIGMAVDALKQGRLVGWFQGAMEWGPRALGARCILANPGAPYVLENLNRFLKRREPWRGYAISGFKGAIDEQFSGPDTAPFMECDYRARDPGRFANLLPSSEAAIRVHTASPDGEPRFARLLQAFGAETGLPFLVNTSFNGFHEPIVCSPLDAVRVFYGSGIDVLVIDQFVLRK
jgi:carbamoyltransferase